MLKNLTENIFPLPGELVRENFNITGELRKFSLIVAQLGILLFIIYSFKIEEGHGLLLALIPLFIGFILHSLLPIRYRLPFFLLLSLVTYGIIIGGLNTLIIVIIGTSLLGILHLPINYWARITLVVIVSIILGLLRIELIPTDWGALVIPIVGSIFMFRMILYAYELRKKPEPASIWQRLSYFFLLPNVLFPLFPIIDYKLFLRTYYQKESYDIYQKGIKWMLRGVTHLLIYKIIYYYFSPSPDQVIDNGSLVVYLLSSYGLLLRISGQSHLIIGMLALFGFDLPMIFNKYFLASGFNDFWRRINIYWKDFVMKIFYYPIFFLFRKWGMTIATIITLLVIFFLTWMLHSYQWFWLQGIFPITAVDGIFWGVFGVLIVINSIIQTKRKKKAVLGKRVWTFNDSFRKSLKIVSMFIFMCLLWSLWMSSSVSEWVSIISVLTKSTLVDIILIIGVIFTLILLGSFLQYPLDKILNMNLVKQKSFAKESFVSGFTAVAILLIGLQNVYAPGKSKFAHFVKTLKENKLNSRDAEIAERGYYEPILKGNQLTAELGNSDNIMPKDWKRLDETDVVKKTDDLYFVKLLPSKKIIFKGAALSTNKWGMRDREYDKEKPANTYRFALLGSSHVMGSGVTDNEVFEQIVEDSLNKISTNIDSTHIEMLNFSVGGYHLLQNVKLADEKIFNFSPDAVIYFAHSKESRRALDRSVKFFQSGIDLEYDFLKQIISETGIKPNMSRALIEKKLKPYADNIVKWGYKKIAEDCRKNGALPIWVFLPTLDGMLNESKEDIQKTKSFATEAGFIIISLDSVYSGYDTEKLQIAPWDAHPNPEAHRLIAKLLLKKLISKEKELNLFNSINNSNRVSIQN